MFCMMRWVLGWDWVKTFLCYDMMAGGQVLRRAWGDEVGAGQGMGR